VTASWFFRKDLGPDDGVTMLRGHLEANRPYARCQEMLEAAHGERELSAAAARVIRAYLKGSGSDLGDAISRLMEVNPGEKWWET
jgi:hypothetical protein